jgi:hypothetical protein
MNMNLRDKVRTAGKRSPHRTGADATLMVPGEGNISVSVIRDSNGNIVGVNRNGTTNGFGGPCGPVMPTQPRSWGAACPTGDCTADSLASMLGRETRIPCRELTYWIKMTATAGGVASFNNNSTVTICPTRVIFDYEGAAPAPTAQLDTFTVGNQNQIVGDGLPVATLFPFSYAIVPFVTDCIKAGMPFAISISGLAAAKVVYFGIVGPAIG